MIRSAERCRSERFKNNSWVEGAGINTKGSRHPELAMVDERRGGKEFQSLGLSFCGEACETGRDKTVRFV